MYDCRHLRTRVLLIARKPMTPCFPDFGLPSLPWHTNWQLIRSWLSVERWNAFRSSAMAGRGPFPVFVEHLAVVYEPASDWGPSVGMHSTAPLWLGMAPSLFRWTPCRGIRTLVLLGIPIAFGVLLAFHRFPSFNLKELSERYLTKLDSCA